VCIDNERPANPKKFDKKKEKGRPSPGGTLLCGKKNPSKTSIGVEVEGTMATKRVQDLKSW